MAEKTLKQLLVDQKRKSSKVKKLAAELKKEEAALIKLEGQIKKAKDAEAKKAAAKESSSEEESSRKEEKISRHLFMRYRRGGRSIPLFFGYISSPHKQLLCSS